MAGEQRAGGRGEAGDPPAAPMRVLQSLRVKICEAKNLLPYPGPNKMRDCFCTVNLDQEEIFRTNVVEKSLNPFYGEDFYFDIPRTFHNLSFYIYDKSLLQRDLRIGKVAIKKEDLYTYYGKEPWFPLQPIDSNSEVQGKVHLELKLNELITDNGSVQQLMVHIVECEGLPLVNGQSCDPYASVSLVGPSRIDQKKTKVKKKTSNPHFNEKFYFEVTRSSSYTKKSQFQVEEEDIEKLEVRVDLWNNGNLAQDVFLGEIRIPVRVLRNDSSHQAWYLLQPKDNGSKSSKYDDLGSLRLSICYTEDYVLSSELYIPLKTLIVNSSDIKPITTSAAFILGEICRDKNDAILPLVRLLLHHQKLVPFVTTIAQLDLNEEANTIFRGNSLATRCMDETMKIVGNHYLKVTLKNVIDEICESPKPCEIDPNRLREGENVDNHKDNLRHYVDKVFSCIVKSSMSCPTVMCDLFSSLRHMAVKNFPNDRHVQYSAVSSFVFLRFFAVAVVSPHIFHLRSHHPDAQTSRVLTLISKTIQTLGSVGSLSKSKTSSFKEPFMCEFYKMFEEESYTADVKKFLEEISSTESKEPSGMSESVILKEGEMYKRAQNRIRIATKPYNKRWFSLTSREFVFHKTKDKEPKFRIAIRNILAVEKLDESAFSKNNMFQVIYGEKPLYILASNCVEASEWIEVLSRVSRRNHRRLSKYHPSAFINGTWLCCKASSESIEGCSPCTVGVPADVALDIDGDRECEKIYSLFSTNMPRLQKMEEACASMAVYQGPEEHSDYHFSRDDSVKIFNTLQQIKTIVEKLNEPHEKYKKGSTSAKYGSQDNPIVGKGS
ncbi:ras GTPase-activating protein 2 [Rhinoderma darwinii]|uniref:ras GTPase-activating protein 2 n=1 Tax=Rhinoderma darwinii TaxID=43563 RepID=UPI003F6644DC